MLIRLKDALHYIMQILVLTLHPNLDMMQLFNHFLFLFKFPLAGQNMINMCREVLFVSDFELECEVTVRRKAKNFYDLISQCNCLLKKWVIPPSANNKKRIEIEVGLGNKRNIANPRNECFCQITYLDNKRKLILKIDQSIVICRKPKAVAYGLSDT